MEKRVNSKTRVLGAIGWPIKQTRSPILINHVCSLMNQNYVYLPLEVKPESFKDAVLGLKALNAKGFNVTMPYKKEIMKYLDCISDEAKLLDSVNTVKLEDGKLQGYNTDYFGFAQQLSDSGVDIIGKKALVIGSGAIGGPVCMALIKGGAGSICILNRTVEKAENLAGFANGIENNIASYSHLDYDELSRQIVKNDIIVNITPVGMSTNNVKMHDFNLGTLNETKTVFDVLYSPMKTPLLQEAEKRGCKIINGFGMFINQAKKSFEIWTEVQIPDDIIKSVRKLIKEEVEKNG